MLDTAYRVEIPGGIELEAHLVGPIARILAFIIDFCLRVVLIIIAAIATIPLGEMGVGFWFVFWFLIEWFYPVLFEVFRRGQTPGKIALGIAVVQDDLTPVTSGTSMVRNLLRAADFMPFFYLAGLVTMLSNSRFQRLGDLAAGTLVISIRKMSGAARIENVAPLAPTTTLSRSEQTAIINFLQRSPQLSEPRQQELAKILDEITHHSAENRVEQLHGMGAWFLGLR